MTMSKRAWIVVQVLAAACFAAGAVASFAMGGCSTCIETASGACVPMRCHYAFIASGFMCLVGAVASAVNLPGLEAAAHRTVATVEFACALFTFAAIQAIGICGDASMHCHQTLHVVLPCLAAAAILAVVQLVKADSKAAQKPKMRL
jgi:hypothetical protein